LNQLFIPVIEGKKAPSSLLTGLVAYWKLDESSGNRIDITGRGNNLSDENTVTAEAGIVGNSAHFALANTEYLNLADTADINGGDIDFTLQAWVYLDSLLTTQFIIAKDGAGGGNEEFALSFLHTSVNFRFVVFTAVDTGKAIVNDKTSAVVASKWYHVLAWHNAGTDTVNIQVNLAEIASLATGGALQAAGSAQFRIGSREYTSSNLYTNGRIDECAKWNRVLTATEREQLYNAGKGNTYPFTSFPQYSLGWTKLADMPGSAEQHGFEELDGVLYVAGGANDVATSLTSVYAYDPVSNAWATKEPLPVAVQSPILRSFNHKLYCIGGQKISPGYEKIGDVYEYDPSLDTWTKKTDMPTAREDMGSAVIDGKIYVFGGLINGAGLTRTKVLEIYDPTNDTWDATKADLTDYKHFGDFGAAVSGKAYAISSSNSVVGYGNLTPNGTVYEYDPGANTWTTKTSAPGVISCYKNCVAVGTDIYVISGVTLSTTTYTKQVWKYDTITDSWSFVGIVPAGMRGIGATTYGGDIYICGGFDGTTHVELYKTTP